MGKILVNLNVPTIERKYNIWIEEDKTIEDTIKFLHFVIFIFFIMINKSAEQQAHGL